VSAINPRALEPYQRRMGEDFVAEIIQTYLDNSPALVIEINKNFAAKNLEPFTRAAHILKSNSATLGAEKLAGLCQKLELAGEKSRLDGLQADITALAKEHLKVCSELRLLLAKITNR
jgi:histidine phosphotransfer protein HptB